MGWSGRPSMMMMIGGGGQAPVISGAIVLK